MYAWSADKHRYLSVSATLKYVTVRAFFSFCCDQVALCRVSVLAARAAPAVTHSSGVLARRVDHHAHFGGVGGTVPTESHRGSSTTAGGIRGKAGPYENAGKLGMVA